jgi:cyclophilin family peptidyl-prolyl cis-trans isomerase
MTRGSILRLAALAAAAAVLAAACSGGSSAAPTAAPDDPKASPAEAPAGGPAGCPTSAPPPLAADATATVTLATEKGDIVVEVMGSLAPNATGNFVALAECGYYDGVVFHRLVPGFVIQGGDGEFGRTPDVDPNAVGTGGPGYTITDDPVTTPYGRGTVAMARTPAPDSAGSQFFIVLDDQARAPLESYNTYAIMGSVTSGMDVVDAIAAMPNSGEPANQALEPVAITKATVARP